MRDKPIKVCAVLMGGSTAETILNIHAALATFGPTEMSVVDLLMFHLRSPGRLSYSRPATVVRVEPADCGISTAFRSSSLNMIASGGGFAFRRIVSKARRILEDLRPDVVVMCHDRLYSELAFAKAAQQLGIPTMLVQEGPFCVIGHGDANALGLKLKYLLAPIAQNLGLLPAMPDYGHAGHALICAASPAYAAKWVASGIAPERMVVTGVPRYDELSGVRAKVVQQRSERAGRVPRVCFLMQPFARHGKVDAQAAFELMRQAGEGFNRAAQTAAFELVIRVHPRGDDSDSAALTGALGIPYSVQKATAPFTSVLPDIDLVVGFYSSAILEALACNVPALCLRLPPAAFAEPAEGAKQDVIAQMGTAVVEDAAAFAQALIEVLGRPPDQVSSPRLHDEIGEIDGHAARRVGDAIMALAKQGIAAERGC